MSKVAKMESRQRGITIKSGPRSRTITVANVKIEPTPQVESVANTPDTGITGMPSRYGIAIHALLAGKSMTAAAAEAGLSRNT